MWKITEVTRTISKFLPILLIAFMICGCESSETSENAQQNAVKTEGAPIEEIAQEPFEGVFDKGDIPEEIREKMYGVTISEKSPVQFDQLSYLTVTHVGYDGEAYIGNLIVDKELADEVLSIFQELYEIRFPIEKMRPAYNYGGVDELSMQDNNTSAFNDRPVTGGSGLSYHQLGRAIDINPLVNPYVKNGEVLPTTADKYMDRTLDTQGLIKADSECVQIFKRYGWKWGGDWNSLKDYQHFEKR